MVKTLQKKFIAASMLAVTILLVTLVGAINLLYCYSVMTRENNMLAERSIFSIVIPS